MNTRSRIASAFAAVALLAPSLLPYRASAAPTAAQAREPFDKKDRGLLAEAKAQGNHTVTVLIAARKSAVAQVVGGIQSLGGTVRYQDTDVDYVRADVPVDKAAAVAGLSGVEAVDLNEVFALPDPRPEGAADPTPQSPPGPSTPAINPYMPIGDTGAAQFAAAHPTWDGRGVVVGIVDTGLDLGHPALNRTSTGERKIVDWVTGTDPLEGGPGRDPTWINMQAQVSAVNGRIAHEGVTYATPTSGGAFRVGLFKESDPLLGGEYATANQPGGDINRDGDHTDVFAVLWDTASNNVWVDANTNRSFADEQAMTDYKVRFDAGAFGTDNPATAVREAVPFVVQTDGKNKFVNIGIVSAAHGSHVAGIVGGNALFGGAMTGAAPGAKYVSLRACQFIAGCTAAALVEGMIFVAKQSNVDVINMSIGGLPSLNDGNNARALLYNRLIEQFNVQMFISAGNSGAGMNTVGDPSVATKVVSVGSYVSRETWQKNYGSDSQYQHNLHPFSSRGPREDGGFKPQVVAPGAAVSSVPTWQAGQPVPGTYALPPGYGMFNGTSMASPQAAGAAALLVSAAKQAGVQKQPAQLRQALLSAATAVDPSRIQTYEQGNGLLNVAAAWELLKTNIKTADITSAVPVNTALGGFLAQPGIGSGIYDREGVELGHPFTRRYTVTRADGPGSTTTYNLSWKGNDGTFSAPGSVALPKGRAVGFDVRVNPTSGGAHSAILNFDDPATAGIDYQSLNVVVVAEEFTAADGYRVVKSGSIARNQYLSYFYRVPVDTPALKVDLAGPSTAPGTGQVRFLRVHPYGVPIDASSSLDNYCPNATTPATCPASALSRTVSDPQAGVWEVIVEARRTSDVPAASFTLTTSILGASVSPNPDIIGSATLGLPVSRSYTLANLFGPFTGRAVGTTLGSARRGTFTIANLAQQTFPVTVTAGSTSLRATIGNPSDAAADLDLFVFNCTTGTCVLAGQNADGDSEESVTIANPAAGNWLVLVDGFSVPAGTTTYAYVDVFVNTGFGSIVVTDANTVRSVGAVWTVPATLTATAAPAVGRVLLGNVQVRTDSNVVVGTGDVVIGQVD